jgi:very-short-patch-repair endonuclease
MKPPIRDLQDAIAETIANEEKAYDIVSMCEYFGLQAKNGHDPWSSKRLYVLSLIKDKSESFLIDLAMKVYDRYQSDDLKNVLGKFAGGVSGEVKNIIFAAEKYKPDLILTDAIHNTVDIATNAQHCLVYDKPITSKGLLWSDLVLWWREKSDCTGDQIERNLYKRLENSLDSEPEKYLFFTYYKMLKPKLGDKLPALIPQVYFHYDPKTLKELQGQRRVPRERMDFLILFSDRDRVVIEVDGVHHYSKADTEVKDSKKRNIASPQEYARMVSEDRKLRLRGYEVYRFGGFELFNLKAGQTILKEFFSMLFEKHGITLD